MEAKSRKRGRGENLWAVERAGQDKSGCARHNVARDKLQ